MADRIKEFNLVKHPVVAGLLHSSGGSLGVRQHSALLHEVILHTDRQTLYDKQAGMDTFLSSKTRATSGQDAVVALQPELDGPIGSRLEFLTVRYASEYVKSQMAEAEPQTVYSLGPRVAASPDTFAMPLMLHFNPGGPAQDAGPSLLNYLTTSGMFFFRVVNLHPERAKLAAAAAALSKRSSLPMTLLTIVPLRVLRLEHDSHRVVLATELGHTNQEVGIRVLNLACLSSVEIASICIWTVAGDSAKVRALCHAADMISMCLHSIVGDSLFCRLIMAVSVWGINLPLAWKNICFLLPR